ncbi:PEP-utilizing enzyme [Tepidiforma sp.]|uniref:PEP-utilizing enzyme n=1 Tax=Tepidiforma sp. TaxID=2682230 RepID=UPI002ADD853D|nr:PEP-utilizing enzyme [Tepidiforma sp.]
MEAVRWIEDQPYNPKASFWTRANVGEVLPEPPSPAGWDLVFANGGTVAGWRDCAVNRLGVGDEELDPDPNRCDFIGLIGGYGYLNATWIRVWGERTPGMSAAAIDAAYFGDHPDVPPYVKEPWHENPATTAVMEKWLAWVMGDMDQSELEADRQLAYEIRRSRPNLAELTDRQLLERAISLRPICRRLFDQHINQSGASSIGPGAIAAICAAIGRPADAMRLIAGLGGVDSAAPSYAMWDLSRMVRNSPALTALFDAGPSGLMERLKASDEPDAREFLAKFDEFLAEYGSRGPNEWDLMAETWETNPDIALAAIDRMRLGDDDASPRNKNAARVAEREKVRAEIREALAGDPATLAQFDTAMKSALTFVPGRERSKTNIVRVIEESRVAMRELGQRAVERGHIDHPRDICFLFQDELEAYVDGRLEGVHELVEARKRHYDWLQSLEPPFIINGPPPANTTWKRKADHTAAKAGPGDVIQGLPGCPGKARGTARVVLDPLDPTVLEPGDILVAPMTDPAWTPLFVPAAAVVVDVGATLSHAIIVSRELGIPCVVSATDATRRIPDGATIEVDGDTGAVTVISLP